MIQRPDRWTMHDPKRCGADEMPEGYRCRCGPFWPRQAMYWRGETAIGEKQVDALWKKYREAKAVQDQTLTAAGQAE